MQPFVQPAVGPTLVAWLVSALVLVAFTWVVGRFSPGGRLVTKFAILLDNRGRFSLTHFQLVLWTLVILSLISAYFWGLLWAGSDDALEFKIPPNVLGLLGISAGSAATTSAVKAVKNVRDPASVAVAGTAPGAADRPRFRQVFLAEEGASADEVVDISKFQQFVVTIILVVAYVAIAIHAIADTASASTAAAPSLPDLSGTFLVLLGISHATYVAAKVAPQAGTPNGATMADVIPSPGPLPDPDAVAARQPPPVV